MFAVAIWALLAQAAECPSALEVGKQLYAERRFSDAVLQFERAHQICNQPALTLLPLAKSLLMAQRLDRSLAAINDFLSVQPAGVDALKLKGDILYLLGRESEAEAALTTALSIQPDHAETQYALGRIRYQQNRFPDAVELFLKLVERDPQNYRAHDNLALSYAALQQDKLAVAHFTRALQLVHKDHPEYDTVYANAASFFLDRKDFEKAFQLGAEAAKRNPAYARNFFLTGKALVQLEKPGLSLRWLQQAVSLDPTYKEAHYWLATVYRKLGNREAAANSLKIFRELSKAPAVSR